MGDYFLFSLSAIVKPTRRKPGRSPDPARPVSDSGTEAAPLLGSGNRGRAILSVSYRNVSAALSLLNKVCNSIYSRNVPAESTSPEPERFFGRRESSVPNSPSPSPTPTPSRRPPWSLVRGGLMNWYLDKFRYRTCIWCNDKWMVQAWAGTYFWGTPEIH